MDEPKERAKSEMSAPADVCRICEGILSNALPVREMMFGTREQFLYFTCETCGCMQISEVPADLGKYYGQNYYSFSESPVSSGEKRLRKNRKRYRIKRAVRMFGNLLPKPKNIFQTLGFLGIGLHDRILDVGSGAGALVNEISQTGFTGILGIDPFLAHQSRHSDGRILAKKASIFDVGGTWRLIMFNHSFEHMDHQAAVLRQCGEILDDDGYVMICIPTVSSYAFRTYGPNWVQLDAPRHLYLHSRNSIAHLAKENGFRVVDMWDDSTAFQFVGSEQYLQDIPLMSENSQIVNPDNSIFDNARINDFRRRATRLNRKGDGDQICVVLARSG